MALQNVQFLVKHQSANPEVTNSEYPSIDEPSDVIVRIKAVAINPADVKMIDVGHRGASYPLVPGLDGAGIVEVVGDGVTNVKVGDEVVALFAPGGRGGTYQHFAVAQANKVAKKPSSWTFEDAASLSVCFFTATMGLGYGLKMSLPYIKNGISDGFKPTSVLVLGGSSALGAATIQLLRIASPDCKILTTASPKHHDNLTKLGADLALDRNSQSLVADVKHFSAGSQGVDAIIDTVGAASSERHVFDVFDSNGPRRYAQVWTGDEEIQVPEGVESISFRSRDFLELQGGENIMFGLQSLLEAGKYGLPLRVNRVGQDADGLAKGLEAMRKGVSGEKLVVTVS